MDADGDSTHHERVRLLQGEVARRGGEGVIVPLADEHGSEYVGAYAHRLRWLTGFTGTAGTAVVLSGRAAIFTDGRYAIQAREEAGPVGFEIGVTPHADMAAWLSQHAAPDSVIFFDAWLFSRARVSALRAGLRPDIKLVPSPFNLVDEVWRDRPPPSPAPAALHPEWLAGASSVDKRTALASAMRAGNQDAVIVAALDSIAWLLNIRGRDIPHLPVARAFLALRADASATLFIDADKVGPTVRAHLGPDVELAPYESFPTALRSMGARRIAVDPEICSEAIFEALAASIIVEAPDPCVLPRALKNDSEIAGAQAAHVRDGVALVRFLHWLERQGSVGLPDEIEAADALLRFREATGKLRELSFATISAAGPSGALPHYIAKAGSARALAPDSLYLVDSGGQYDDGTTDVTRTVALGEPSAEMRRRFTQALRGHIAVASGSFPPGTTGGLLDPLARQFLWQGGVDYATGTGHGVGSFLAVHEGPAYIGKRGGTRPTEEPIRPRMILSVEPGYYLEGAWGIRTENLYLVVERGVAGSGWFGFEPLTLVPIDRKLIDTAELSRAEREWIDQYHAKVRRELTPHLDTSDAAWLADACSALTAPARDEVTA